jgi:hypothetical protein
MHEEMRVEAAETIVSAVEKYSQNYEVCQSLSIYMLPYFVLAKMLTVALPRMLQEW